MHANTSPLQPSADGPEAAAQAAPSLPPLGRYLAAVLASPAISSGVDEPGIRRLFSGCEEAGLGLGAEFEAGVLAALRAS